MTRDEIAELAAGYALGGLDAADHERFEARLAAGDPEALAALRDCEETLARLAAETPAASPPALRAAVMARLEATPRAPDLAATRGRPRRRSPWAAVWAATAAAGIAAILVGLAVSGRYERRLADLEREAAAIRREVAEQRALLALLRDAATLVVALAGQPAAPDARARILWHPREGGLLIAAGLPGPGPGKAYQLWAIVGRAAPVSAGTFGVDSAGAASVRFRPVPDVDQVDVFAVTLERAGGVPAPTGPMVLAGKT